MVTQPRTCPSPGHLQGSTHKPWGAPRQSHDPPDFGTRERPRGRRFPSPGPSWHGRPELLLAALSLCQISHGHRIGFYGVASSAGVYSSIRAQEDLQERKIAQTVG